jgi:putative heme-binding domain-containing protein
MKAGDPSSSRRIETQLLHFERTRWNAYTYRWNEAQTDAELVPKNGAETKLVIDDASAPGGRREQTWRFLGRTECFRCHLDRFGPTIGFIPQQLASKLGGNETELERLKRLGVIAGGGNGGQWKLASPHDDTASTELRARSWLHANCGHCHRRDANASVMIQFHGAVPQAQMAAVDVAPNRGGFGLADAKIVTPGAPEKSSLLYRIATTASGRMPAVGSSIVDEAGLSVVARWVETLATTNRPARPSFDDLLKAKHDSPSAALALALDAAATKLSAKQMTRLAELAETAAIPTARDLLERFLPAEKRRQLLGANPSLETILARQGDAVRGREIFFGVAGAQCHTCHRHGAEGREVGPDLTAISSKFDRAALLDQILHPAKQVDEQWRTHEIETTDGNTRTGFLLTRDAASIRFRLGDGTLSVNALATIRHDRILPGSLMPEGLLQSLTAQEAADLVEFLSPAK